MTLHGDRQRVETELQFILHGAPWQQDELAGSLARYVCVLSSSYLEASIRELIQLYCANRAAGQVVRYVTKRMQRFRNPNTEKILQVIGNFDPEARERLENAMTDEEKAGIDSIAANRNNIAHGRQSGISLGQANRYHSQAKRMIARVRCELNP